MLRDSMRHHDNNLCVGCRSGCKNHIAPALTGWFCAVTWEGDSVLWKAVKSPDSNGYYRCSQRSGKNEKHRRNQGKNSRTMIYELASLDSEYEHTEFGAEGGT